MWKCNECGFAYNEDAADVCEQCNVQKPKKDSAGIDFENLLRKIAWGILGLGILGAIILVFTVGYTNSLYGVVVDWGIMVYGLITLISSVLTWALLNVIANISCRLKSIDDKMS